MKTLIICHSSHKLNTLQIAKAMAEVLDADILTPQMADPEKIVREYDIIGFGSGIYAGRHHKSLFDLVNKMPQTSKNVFIFSTKALPKVTIYHALLRSRLMKKGYEVLNEFSCTGFSTYGPLKIIGGVNAGHPNDFDIKNATTFATSLKAFSVVIDDESNTET